LKVSTRFPQAIKAVVVKELSIYLQVILNHREWGVLWCTSGRPRVTAGSQLLLLASKGRSDA
jgi:hypothetical protein